MVNPAFLDVARLFSPATSVLQRNLLSDVAYRIGGVAKVVFSNIVLVIIDVLRRRYILVSACVLTCLFVAVLLRTRRHAQVGRVNGIGEYRVSWEALKQDPSGVIVALGNHVELGAFPRVVFEDSKEVRQEGRDGGGLIRHLVSEAFLHALKAGLIPGNRLPGELLDPKCGSGAAAKALFRAIGFIFAEICLDPGRSDAERGERRSLMVLVGEVFDLQFFVKILDFSSDELARYRDNPVECVKNMFGCHKRDIIGAVRRARDREALMRIPEVEYGGIDLLEGVSFAEQKEQFLREYIEAGAETQAPHYVAAFLVAEAMEVKMGGAAWDDIRRRYRDPQRLQEFIQGSFTREKLVKRVKITGNVVDSDVLHLGQWMAKQTDDQLKELLQFATGSLAIPADGPSLQISFSVHDRWRPLPPIQSHTCSRQLCIPSGYPNQEAFDEAMDLALRSAREEGFGQR